MSRLREAALVLLLLAFGLPARAWNDLGHEVIALIAYQHLSTAARLKVDAILASDPQHRDLLAASVWPDKHRSHPKWHYVNIPYRPGAPRGRVPGGESVISAIRELEQELRQGRGAPEEQANALANLIHFVGDCHQPMHSVARFTPATPGGDRGGNDVLLRGRWKNLHQLWDNGLNLGGARPTAQFMAAEVVREYPSARLHKQLQVRAPEAWAQESYEVAVRQAYALDETGVTRALPSERYLDGVARTSRDRVALAGYRLAGALETALAGRSAGSGSRVSMTAVSPGANTETVYATRTGTKYHKAGCRFLRGGATPISKTNAQARGLTPCSVCRP